MVSLKISQNWTLFIGLHNNNFPTKLSLVHGVFRYFYFVNTNTNLAFSTRSSLKYQE